MSWWTGRMYFKLLTVISLLLSALLSPSGAPLPAPARAPQEPGLTPNATIASILQQVSEEDLYQYAGDLSGEWPVTIGGQQFTLSTRYSRSETGMEKATQYVYERLQDLELEVQYHEYQLTPGEMRRNVIAEQPGRIEPDCIYILSAHLDSTSEDPQNYAPGADDNASGVSAVLHAAELLSQHTYRCTLRYALFTGEEQGLIGSRAYASQVREDGEDIRGVLNLDMIGYNSSARPEPVMELHTRQDDTGDLGLAEVFTEVVSAYELDLIPQVLQDGPWYSDHAAFWGQGYPAVIAIEDHTAPDRDTTPEYHSTDDQVESLNFEYLASFTQAAVGAMAHLGGLITGSLSGTVSQAASGLPLEGVTVSASPGEYSTTTIGGAYSLPLPAGQYTLTFEEPWHALEERDGISILDGEVKELDIQLQALPIHQVSGSVHSAGSQSPLSATITVLDFPLPPIQTDPSSGAFSLELPEGEHRLEASASGYYSQQRLIQLEADHRVDFTLFLRQKFFLPLLEILMN